MQFSFRAPFLRLDFLNEFRYILYKGSCRSLPSTQLSVSSNSIIEWIKFRIAVARTMFSRTLFLPFFFFFLLMYLTSLCYYNTRFTVQSKWYILHCYPCKLDVYYVPGKRLHYNSLKFTKIHFTSQLTVVLWYHRKKYKRHSEKLLKECKASILAWALLLCKGKWQIKKQSISTIPVNGRERE